MSYFLKKPENEELQRRAEQRRWPSGPAAENWVRKILLIQESMGWGRSGSFNGTVFFEEEMIFSGKEAAFASVLNS